MSRIKFELTLKISDDVDDLDQLAETISDVLVEAVADSLHANPADRNDPFASIQDIDGFHLTGVETAETR